MKGESLIKYLHDEKVRMFAFKTDFFIDKNTDFASDFDVFSALCQSNLFFAGHYVRAELLSVLKSCVSNRVEPFFLCSPNYRKELWQRVFYDEEDFSVSATDTLDIGVTDFYVSEKSIGIKDLVDFSCDTIFEALNKTLEKINDDGIGIIDFDARDLVYSRPDDFHAGESYRLLSEGESGDVFFLWLLCRIFMNLDVKLRLKADSVPNVKKVLNLLSSLKLFPKTYISFDISKENEYEELLDIVLKDHKKNISLELDIPKEIDKTLFSDTLKKIFEVIPLVLIKVDYSSADRFCDALDLFLVDTLALDERELLIGSLRKAR